MAEQEIGHVSHYFGKILVAAVEITGGSVSVGDSLHFVGNTTDCKCTVESMQVEHETITDAKKGHSIAIKISERVRQGDRIFKVED